MRWLAAGLGLLAAAHTAQAQDPFSLDPVMVTWIYADSPVLKDIAYDLRQDLETLIYGSYLVVPLSSVRPYDDYDAETYLDSCRDDGQVECGYVIAARGQADWAVVGQMDVPAPGRPPNLLLSVIDVANSREVMSFTSAVTIDNHQAIADGLSLVLDQVLAGAADLSDDRQRGRELWELRREQREERHDEADAIDRSGELDDLTRTIVAREDERVRVGDLTQYEGRDDVTPWDRVGLGQREYVRYQNSGKSLAEWRARRRGRAGTIRLRAIGGFGSGPYDHVYDGRYVVSPDPPNGSETVGIESFQALERGGGSLFGVELGVGLTPWIEVNAGIAGRGVEFTASVLQENIVNLEGSLIVHSFSGNALEVSWGALVSPLPTFRIRPIFAPQIVLWRGLDMQRSAGLPLDSGLRPFPTPTGVFLRLAPGVEIQASKRVLLFSRVNVNARLIGETVEQEISGGDVLIQKAETPTGAGPVGVDWVFGVEVPIGPFFGKGD